MKNFQAHCRRELDFLDALHEDPDMSSDSPGTLPAVVVEVVRDKAARLGLADLVKKAPPDATFDDARWYLAEALGELAALQARKASPNDLLTVTEVARRLKVNRDKILGWINYGRLKARNTAKGALGRPRWRIKPDDLEDFLAGRAGRV
jgi:excisionase family DNA binding protein